jgi:methyl-accepting chemotaxis protein
MNKSSTIKFRMIALTAMVLFFMTLLGGAGYYTCRIVEERIIIADLLERETTSLHMVLRNIAEIVLIPDNPQTVKNVREEVQVFGNTLESLITKSDDKRLVESLNTQIKPEWKKIEQDVLTFLKIARPNPEDVDTMITFGKLSSNTDKLLKLMTQFRQESRQRTNDYIEKITTVMGSIALFLILVTAGVLTSILRSISKPLEEISISAQAISKGNLKVEIAVIPGDEIGVVAASFRDMVLNLRQMISQTSAISSDVNSAASQIADSSGLVFSSVRVQNIAIEHTVRSMEEVDNSVTLLQENSRQLFDDATATSSAATELAASIAQVADNAGELDSNAFKAVADLEEMFESGNAIVSSVEKLSSFAKQTIRSIEQIGSTMKNVQDTANRSVSLAEQVSRASSEQGMTAIKDAMAGIENIRHSVSALTEVVNRLGTKSVQIGKIITVIEDIASQTGLLALNAAILAAQAGQHGRSFAVVASEIRSLSDRTFLSTKEIVDVITSVQAESSSSVKMAQAGMDAVQQGVTLIERVNNALLSIYDTSLASTEMSHTIHKETTAEVAVINQINESIVVLRDQIDEISRAVHRQNGSTGDINRLMEQIKQIAWEIAVATREQSKTSVQISQIADNLMNQSNGINTSVAIQKQKSRAVITASSSIRETSDQLGELAQSLEQAADALREKAKNLTSSINSFEV